MTLYDNVHTQHGVAACAQTKPVPAASLQLDEKLFFCSQAEKHLIQLPPAGGGREKHFMWHFSPIGTFF